MRRAGGYLLAVALGYIGCVVGVCVPLYVVLRGKLRTRLAAIPNDPAV